MQQSESYSIYPRLITVEDQIDFVDSGELFGSQILFDLEFKDDFVYISFLKDHTLDDAPKKKVVFNPVFVPAKDTSLIISKDTFESLINMKVEDFQKRISTQPHNKAISVPGLSQFFVDAFYEQGYFEDSSNT